MPTRRQPSTLQVSSASHTLTANQPQLQYGGGIAGTGIETAPKVYIVFVGSQWGTAGTDANGYTTLSGDSQGTAPRLQAFFKGLGTNSEG